MLLPLHSIRKIINILNELIFHILLRTIKIFQFSKQHALDKEYEVLEVIRMKLDSAPSSLAFSTSSIICGTDRIVEIDFHKQTVEAYLADAELRKTHQEKPIDMFALYDGGKVRKGYSSLISNPIFRSDISSADSTVAT
jgi:hypothetical protein